MLTDIITRKITFFHQSRELAVTARTSRKHNDMLTLPLLYQQEARLNWQVGEEAYERLEKLGSPRGSEEEKKRWYRDREAEEHYLPSAKLQRECRQKITETIHTGKYDKLILLDSSISRKWYMQHTFFCGEYTPKVKNDF